MRILEVMAIAALSLSLLAGCQSANVIHSSNNSTPTKISTENNSKGLLKNLNTLLKGSGTLVRKVEMKQGHQHLYAIFIALKFTLKPPYGSWSIPNNQKVNIAFPKQIASIVQQSQASVPLELVNADKSIYEIQYESIYSATNIPSSEIENVKRHVNEIRCSFSGVSGS